jgi:hypothetical protein
MSSQKQKNKKVAVEDFVSDGLDNKQITEIVQDIMKIIHDNKSCRDNKSASPPLSHTAVVHNMTQEDKFKFFIERYPMLFDMVTKEEGFDYSFLEYFLSKREVIIKKQKTSDEIHKQVGQEMFDLYYKKQ